MLTILAAVAAMALPAPKDDCATKACLRRTCISQVCQVRVREKRWRREQRALATGTKAMLARLRGCETRGIPYPWNYRYNGAHDGAYQYDSATWHEAGGQQEEAWMASPAEQDVRTARFYPSHRGRWACRA